MASAWLVAACEAGSPPSGPASEPSAALAPAEGRPDEPVDEPADGPREGASERFGQPLETERELTALASILGTPERFDGRVVRTEGRVERVCQKMGCWMELACDEGSVRIPMAGHSFFIPKDAAGRRATVEGKVGVKTLDRRTKDHLRAEGARQVAALHIAATGVELR
jgi:hypothetical protein